MRCLLFVALLALPVVSYTAELVTAEDWSRPRDGAYITQLPSVASTVKQIITRNDHALLIRYPEGEEGILWAQELRDWLVALGISSERVDITAGSVSGDVLELAVIGADGVEVMTAAPPAPNPEVSPTMPQPILDKGGQQ